VVDGCLRPVPPGPMAVLRALTRRPGWVIQRADLLAELPGGGADEHAVEAAVARLRSCMHAPDIVQTVVKRGYRLAVLPPAPGDHDHGSSGPDMNPFDP
jgi:uroporphyrinogen-III synthase